MMRIPEWRSPRTGSTLLERLMLAALLPTIVVIYVAIWFAWRAIAAAWS